MDQDFNPGPDRENPPGNSGDRLVSALEELIQGRRPGAGIESGIASGIASGSATWEQEGALPGVSAEQCPEPGEWALLLGEAARPAELARVNALLAHAAECRECTERLRAFSADLSPGENDVLAQLDCASTEGQRNLAAKLAQTPRQFSSGRATRLYLWTGAGLAASLLISVGLFSWWRLENNPERLLAEAYTHNRTFDLRIPGAGFAEVTPEMHLRGGAKGRESSKELEARARIERNIEAAPENAHWLQLEARSDILEEKFDPAIDILDRLLAAGPVTASLLLDDASAYFQRGEDTGSDKDRAAALEYLRRADELAPGDPVVLFNEAVAMEDRGELMNAVETWNRYLRLERDPRWEGEGRRRLQALEEKLSQLKSHQSLMDQQLAKPEAMHVLVRATLLAPSLAGRLVRLALGQASCGFVRRTRLDI
jgi:tetratricopeptide (TPR) repeat protein